MLRIVLRIFYKTFLLVPLFSMAQSNQRNQIALEKIVPPSPEAAQMVKYGNIPVNHSTGAISIDVPVYTITTAQLKWPVSISYHASGIKVDELSSCVGLGWGLNGMGVITRSIVGTPDEYGQYRNNIPYTIAEYNQLTDQQKFNVVSSATAGEDTEPDIYAFNFNGLSGKFYLHRQKGVILQSEANLKIIPGGSSFTIIDDNGNTYYFTVYESTAAANYMLEYNWNGEPFASGKTETHDGITGIYLTKVVSQDRSDSIQFVYGRTYTIRQTQEQYSFKIGQIGFFGGIGGRECFVGSQFPDLKKTNVQNSTTGAPVLTEILFSQGKLVFNYQYDREDMGRSMNAIGNQGRLTSIDVYKKRAENSYELFQQCKLYQSYFRSPASTNTSNKDTCFGYRLKLDSVRTFDAGNKPLTGAYKFEYNTTYTLPYRTSYSQDFWGFYNGASNTNLMPKRVVTLNNNAPFEVGTANRESSAAQMQASILKKIHYPTGGFSVFDYEPHKYWDPQLTVIPAEPQYETETLTATPGQQTHNPKKRFNHQTASQTVSITAFFKAWYGKSDRAPHVAIKEVLSNGSFQNVLTLDGTDPHNDKTEHRSYILVQGKQYEIEAYVHAGSWPVNEVWSSISLSHMVSPGGPGTPQGGYRTVGGLRINSIINCTAAGDTATRELYAYGTSGEGMLVTPLDVFKREYRTVNEKVTFTDAQFICLSCSYSYRIYHEQSPYSVGTINGSIIAYDYVEKTRVDKLGKPLGKESYQYTILTDEVDQFPDTWNYYTISNDWKNAKLYLETTYSVDAAGNFFPIKTREYNYRELKKEPFNYLIISKKYPQDCFNLLSDYNVFQGKYYTGRKLPWITVETIRSKQEDGTLLTLTDTTTYEYSSTSSHNNPIALTRTSSAKKNQKQRFYYPQDMISMLGDNGGGIYTSMVQKGITGPLVLQRDSSGTTPSYEQKTEFASPYNTFIKPIKTFARTSSNSLELEKEVKYATNGLVIEQALKNNVRVAYVWDYFQTYPVAEVINATNDQIAFTSFESNGTGNWTIGSGNRNTTSAISGKRSYELSSGALTKSGLDPAKTYIFSCWAKPGASITVKGTQSTRQSLTVNGWNYLEKSITGISAIIVSGSGLIDEVRLYPEGAMMTTYTFEPLAGISGACDARNDFTYYAYDGLGRLLYVRDKDRNVIKQMNYQYQQPAR